MKSKLMCLLALLLLLSVVDASYVAGEPDTEDYCTALEEALPGRIIYPHTRAYQEAQESYYAGQEKDLLPACIFKPNATNDVVHFMNIIASNIQGPRNKPQFAVRSGGHSLWAGAANIGANGITIDMRDMHSVTMNGKKTMASIQPGAIWSDIYPQLETHNLTVMGGRVPYIGVGGYNTGGGIHYLSRKHGWACDNIAAYEVVLANGEVVVATATSHHELWLALKGGSNNFGIVTRFDTKVWPMDLMWGGTITLPYSDTTLKSTADAFAAFMDEDNFDASAHMWTSLSFTNNQYSLANFLYYVEPESNPAVFKNFTSMQPQTSNTLALNRTSAMVNSATGRLPPGTSRAIGLVYSMKSGDAAVYEEIFHSWETAAKELSTVSGIHTGILFQPHPVSGGVNSLGLEAGRKDLVLVDLTVDYIDPRDDEVVQAALQKMLGDQKHITKKHGLDVPFTYLNYADKSQDPIGSYGLESKARLQRVSRKYDPHGVFQNQMPGGFKLFP
ncbi:hypothetical protein NLG97_g2229 [Lecanicillium saksenae]|uniref:Uncharacterized protein n=1 Tax=Lecanicillium saksenae TaxID=468837 RepID=A0ACC1R5K1_9HYPO|nr:hypothetical protein NLG97_g2229 [Lecanicillium saksenae]